MFTSVVFIQYTNDLTQSMEVLVSDCGKILKNPKDRIPRPDSKSSGLETLFSGHGEIWLNPKDLGRRLEPR